MQKYTIKVKLIRDYLQAKFGEEAQQSLKVKAGNKAKVEDDDSWKRLLYKDKKGIYIPSIQIISALIGGGKGIKKKPYGSFKEVVQSYFLVSPEQIYLGKQEPDYIKVSYPARKDGMRVRLAHPAFKAGLTFEFELLITSDEVDKKTVELILEKAGLEKGIGAWRAGGHGRFEIVGLKKIK